MASDLNTASFKQVATIASLSLLIGILVGAVAMELIHKNSSQPERLQHSEIDAGDHEFDRAVEMIDSHLPPRPDPNKKPEPVKQPRPR